MAHKNDPVELAMQILECRRKLRLAALNDATIKNMRAEMKLLEQKLCPGLPRPAPRKKPRPMGIIKGRGGT